MRYDVASVIKESSCWSSRSLLSLLMGGGGSYGTRGKANNFEDSIFVFEDLTFSLSFFASTTRRNPNPNPLLLDDDDDDDDDDELVFVIVIVLVINTLERSINDDRNANTSNNGGGAAFLFGVQ